MPWKRKSKEEQKFDLVGQMMTGEASVAELSQRFGISRHTAYKWLHRYRARRWRGLHEKSRRPLCLAAQSDELRLRPVRCLRRRRPTWGARKLRHVLVKRFGV